MKFYRFDGAKASQVVMLINHSVKVVSGLKVRTAEPEPAKGYVCDPENHRWSRVLNPTTLGGALFAYSESFVTDFHDAGLTGMVFSPLAIYKDWSCKEPADVPEPYFWASPEGVDAFNLVCGDHKYSAYESLGVSDWDGIEIVEEKWRGQDVFQIKGFGFVSQRFVEMVKSKGVDELYLWELVDGKIYPKGKELIRVNYPVERMERGESARTSIDSNERDALEAGFNDMGEHLFTANCPPFGSQDIGVYREELDRDGGDASFIERIISRLGNKKAMKKALRVQSGLEARWGELWPVLFQTLEETQRGYEREGIPHSKDVTITIEHPFSGEDGSEFFSLRIGIWEEPGYSIDFAIDGTINGSRLEF